MEQSSLLELGWLDVGAPLVVAPAVEATTPAGVAAAGGRPGLLGVTPGRARQTVLVNVYVETPGLAASRRQWVLKNRSDS